MADGDTGNDDIGRVYRELDVIRQDAKRLWAESILVAKRALSMERAVFSAMTALPYTVHEPGGWRDVKLSEVLSASLISKLDSAGRVFGDLTLGGLEAFTKDHRLTDIRGLGPIAATKIEDKVSAWFDRNPDFAREAKKPKAVKRG